MPGQGHNLEVDDNVPRRLRSEGAMKDVFAMVKGYMSDQSLIQPPLLCYPASFAASTENYFNQINSTREVVHQELEAERIAELESLAAAISKDFPTFLFGCWAISKEWPGECSITSATC